MQKLAPIIQFTKDMIQAYQHRRVSRSAAEFAYFFTLSVFPLLICAVAILASFEMTVAGLFADEWAVEIVTVVLDYISHVEAVPSVQILLAAVTVIVTSSSAAFRAVAKSMEDIQGQARYQGIVGLVMSVSFSLVLLFTIYFSVVMITTGAWLMDTVEMATGVSGLAAMWQRLRFVVLFAVLVVIVHVMYILTAPGAPKVRRLPGAVFAAAALVVGSMIFSVFMGASARYPLIYGSLASFILLMVWSYLCGNILIVGNLFNYRLYRRKHPKMEQ
ncbi:MAG: YihY family inner membrane protein [Oscillospiraceae bacterium]|nr:YihY family inner membrane protein [Oscillospiraceae bacterium]